MKRDMESEILSKINYEFRDSLNAIMGMIDIIEKTEDIDKINDSIRKIKRTSQELLESINVILEISNRESSGIELKLVEFSTEEMFKDVFDIIEFVANEKNIGIEIDILDNKDMCFLGDVKKLSQVYINLLSNAIKHTDADGKISISVKHKENNLGLVELISTIKDGGTGMTEEQILEAYNGVEFTISKNIIELMQGKIEIDNSVKFNVFLKSCNNVKTNPVIVETKKNQEMPMESMSKVRYDFSGKTIMIFEDVDINREIVRFLLEDTGVTCVEAVDGMEGLELYIKNPEKYDLILMDIQMPNVDGFEATRRIRESGKSNSRTIPIIAMTANVFENQIKEILNSGMNAHLGKPLDEMTMKKELAKYL